MRYYLLTGLALGMLFAGPLAQAQSPGEVVSTGKNFDLKRVLKEESTTILLFIQETSTIEKSFQEEIENHLPDNGKIVLRVVRVKNLDAPALKQYEVTATPTAIVYDRFGRVLARTSQSEEIRQAVRKGQLMARIAWTDEDDPKAAEVYGMPPQAIKRGIPGIVKTMAHTPKAFAMFNLMSEIHFSNGFLTRKEHEMIAAYVSGLNKCKF